MKRLICLFSAAWTALLASGFVQGQAPSNDGTQAELWLEARQAPAGESVLAGVRLQMPPGWHTYWRNPGDSGAPTEIEWDLPEGVTAGAIQWPVPEKFVVQELTSYGYHDEVILLVPLQLAADLAKGELNLKAEVNWLECKELCIPGSAQVNARLDIGDSVEPSSHSASLQEWKNKLPEPVAAQKVTAQWDGRENEKPRPLIITWKAEFVPADADFYPYPGGDYEVTGETERFPVEANQVRLRKNVIAYDAPWPDRLTGLIVGRTPGGEVIRAFETVLTPGSRQPGAASASAGAVAASSPASTGNLAASSGEGGAASEVTGMEPAIQTSLWKMLGLAFLGGLILNIMPCVLPVISLKILGFVNQSHESPGRVKWLGFLFTLGVLISFLALAAVVIAVKGAGSGATWGMQMQNPYFRLVMTVIVTLVALNLFGVFEVFLGSQTMGAASQLASKEGGSGAFFHGVLATLLATPCTAPFLAPAVGFAFSQSAPMILLFFLTIGLGLAAPYFILSWQPRWLKFLPKPGPWMNRFKVIMGFPMLATAIWLFDLTVPAFGEDGALWLGLFLVTIGLAAWVWGEFAQRAVRYRRLGMTTSLVILAVGYFLFLEGELNWRSLDSRRVAQSSPAYVDDSGITWQNWSPEAVQQAQANGRPVLVDFTADWCLTCKMNKRTSLDAESVKAKLKEFNVATFRADNTNPDPQITDTLQKHGRAGVPLNLVYPGDPNAEAIVLPTVLTPQIVINALEKASAQQTTAEADEESRSRS